MLRFRFALDYAMKILQDIQKMFAKKEESLSEIMLAETPEFEKYQWSALYLTNIDSSLTELKQILSGKFRYTEDNIFTNELTQNDKISVLNAINPGTFVQEAVSGIVILVNATSFSDNADLLLKELYHTVIMVTKAHPGVIIGANPLEPFSAEDLEAWLKRERNRYFFIE